MSWIVLAFGAAFSWGLYGASLHRGQIELGNPLRALLCVGVAYFLIGVLVPVVALDVAGRAAQLQRRPGPRPRPSPARSARSAPCSSSSRSAPAALPTYVMPIVFGGAPLINVLTTMIIHPPKSAVSPLFYLGFFLTAAGAGMVLYFRPQS